MKTSDKSTSRHYQAAFRRRHKCSVEGCSNLYRAKGLCHTHYNQVIKAEGGERYAAELNRFNAANRSDGGRFTQLKFSAKRRDLDMSLSREEFLDLTSMPCYYCGGFSPNGKVGLDRVDNSQGYTPGNVVPCCEADNRAKLSDSQDDYIARCIRIAAIHGSKRKA